MGGDTLSEPTAAPTQPEVRQPTARNTGVGAAGGGRVSIREFVDDCEAKRNPDKITAIGEYMKHHEGKELFTRDEIKGRFRQAGEAAPANFPRDFAWAIKVGWIAEDAQSPGSYYVTRKGEGAVAEKFSEDVKKATSQPHSRRRPRKARLAIVEGESE